MNFLLYDILLFVESTDKIYIEKNFNILLRIQCVIIDICETYIWEFWKSKLTEIFIKIYLLSYKSFKFVLDIKVRRFTSV